ncbi:MAG: hypothetical protein KFH87_01130 [Bacteroidetes bacterium]|nr:hypothetical protein [Bacteroidota bacterium]
MSVSLHIGLEIAERSFRFVEIQKQDRQTTILQADILETAHDYASPLLYELPYQRELARDFIRDLATVFLTRGVYAESLSLVLPSMLPLVAMLPFDQHLSASMKQMQLEWDCRTLAGLTTETPQTILSHDLEHAHNTLAMAMPAACVDVLNSTCEHLTLQLLAIDTDHFVMENLVRMLYPYDAEKNFAVLGLSPDHCVAGLYRDKRYLGFRQTSVTYKQHYAAQAVHLLEKLPSFRGLGNPDHIFVYGSAASDDVIESLNGILPGNVIRCVPLADTGISDSIMQSMRTVGEQQFDIAASAALLGLL